MRRFTGLAEVEAAVGDALGYSDWHEITQDEISLFADATHDHYWIHTDPEQAAAGPFGSTIAHGLLTLAHVPVFISEVYAVDGVTLMLNYGFNKVRFPAPTPVNGRVRGAVEIAAVERGAKGTQVVSRVTVELEGSDRPVCVAEMVVMCFE
jgi:acyl dehydratase